MQYRATFGINCGVSHGFGLKDPDYVTRTEKVSAENPQAAYNEAMIMAAKFADDYLSDPNAQLTTVRLLSLMDGKSKVPFDASAARVKRTMLEHLLSALSQAEKLD